MELLEETRAASVSLFAAKYFKYVFQVVCEPGPFASASHRATNCIRVMPVSEARPLMVSSISANVDVIKSRDLLDGRPGFFGAQEDVGVEGWDVSTATTGGDRVSSSGPPAGSTTIGTGAATFSDILASSGTFAPVAEGGA